MTLRHIDSPQNPTIKSIAKLRTRRGRQQQDRIVIDGQREVSRAIACGVELEAIFVPQNVVESSDETIQRWTNSFDVCSLSERPLDKVTYGQRQSIVAVAKTPDHSIGGLQLNGSPRVIAVLEGVEKPGNVGAVLRSADGAGIDAVVLVDPVTDLYNPNAIRASLGTIFSMAVATASFEEYVAWSETGGYTHLLARCEPDAQCYRNVRIPSNVAIVLGSEAHGLAARWSDIRTSIPITIPMHGVVDSLNVSVSAALLFYEYSAKKKLPKK